MSYLSIIVPMKVAHLSFIKKTKNPFLKLKLEVLEKKYIFIYFIKLTKKIRIYKSLSIVLRKKIARESTCKLYI